MERKSLADPRHNVGLISIHHQKTVDGKSIFFKANLSKQTNLVELYESLFVPKNRLKVLGWQTDVNINENNEIVGDIFGVEHNHCYDKVLSQDRVEVYLKRICNFVLDKTDKLVEEKKKIIERQKSIDAERTILGENLSKEAEEKVDKLQIKLDKDNLRLISQEESISDEVILSFNKEDNSPEFIIHAVVVFSKGKLHLQFVFMLGEFQYKQTQIILKKTAMENVQ